LRELIAVTKNGYKLLQQVAILYRLSKSNKLIIVIDGNSCSVTRSSTRWECFRF